MDDGRTTDGRRTNGRRTDDGRKQIRTKKNWMKKIRTKKFGRNKIGGKAWGKARVTEIPEGGVAPPDPPTTTFQKICPPGKFFEMREDFGVDGRRRNVRPKIEPIEKTECIEPKFYRSYRSKAALAHSRSC